MSIKSLVNNQQNRFVGINQTETTLSRQIHQIRFKFSILALVYIVTNEKI